MWALGVIGDPQAVPRLVALAAGDDPGLRKAAVHALGAFPTEDARAALATALSDPVADVRWNAAVALARRRDPAAVPVLLAMMDRGELARGARPHRRAALGGDGAGGDRGRRVRRSPRQGEIDPRVAEKLRALRESDPDLKVPPRGDGGAAAMRTRGGVLTPHAAEVMIPPLQAPLHPETREALHG